MEVVCLDQTLDAIREVFFKTKTLYLYSVSLTSSDPGAVDLPEDLLSDKRSEKLYLNCPPTASPPLNLTIDANTFEFTRFNTTYFEINHCDLLAQEDLSFLTGFSVLNTLEIKNTLNIDAFSTLPTKTLPALKEIRLTGCTGLGNVEFPDLTPARLERLYLDSNGLDDTAAGSILGSLGSSSSVSSLQQLHLSHNTLSKVPRIATFSNVNYYDVAYNTISFMSQSSLIFGPPVTYLGLNDLGLTAIEGGTFQGIIL